MGFLRQKAVRAVGKQVRHKAGASVEKFIKRVPLEPEGAHLSKRDQVASNAAVCDQFKYAEICTRR
jgi:hypothetical protein